ncbi:TVP38/TMEM64 family protein [Niallia sp. FSL W8-0635]|uniref:TVP38/TMEM64 family protein n=1 Tax=Niallia sp. FSL W8-0635 TaxID=2975337 RepID=UPI002B019F59|nr:TVP38/TMEM64 family protein [Yersinia enterocolitica]
MDEFLLQLFQDNRSLAILISVITNIIISILGVIPSFFITAANITFFGLTFGIILSVIGEAIGAIISFWLYRKGFYKLNKHIGINNKYLTRLQNKSGWEAFNLIVALRIFPFIPSGIVTLISATSNVSLGIFALASSLGKLPALVLEGLSVQFILTTRWEIKIGLCILSILLLCIIRKNRTTK